MLLIGLSVNRMLTSSSIEIEIRTSHLNGILFKVRHCDSEYIEGSFDERQWRPEATSSILKFNICLKIKGLAF